jgi:glycosyltransferase involved in cell wall biosynthesis
MNILAYVQLRNIHGSTGHGRVSRQITEHLANNKADEVHILADQYDYRAAAGRIGRPWTSFEYHFHKHETSLQQAIWALAGRPLAEAYWPRAEVIYSTVQSYVPTRKARSVVILHDAAIHEKRAVPASWQIYRARLKQSIIYSRLWAKVDLVHTVSQFSAERIAHYYPSLRSRIRVVYNGVSPCFFSPTNADDLMALDATGLAARPFILVPGGLNYRKNADLILAAWPLIKQMHPTLTLVVAGHSESAYCNAADRIGGGIKRAGFVSDEVLCGLYDAAELVWFPSRYEGFGMPVLEAMARGKAVVTSDGSSLPEVAGGAALLASPTNSNAHVEAIDALLRDPEQRLSLGRLGRTRAKSFTWDVAAKELRAHFASLL